MINIYPTVTIGIPAFNEEENVGQLIDQLLLQKQNSYKLEQVIVVSDGSTDKTVQIVKNKHKAKVKVKDYRQRKGKSVRQNQIIKGLKSDILVLLDADISLSGNLFIENLIKPVSQGADLSSCRVLALKPRNFFEKILNESTKFQDVVISKIFFGDSVYACHGAARAFSKKLYSKLKFPNSIGEDAYSYFYCKKNGYRFSYVKNAKIYIKLPSNLNDHLKQSKRFKKSQKNMNSIFKGLPELKTYTIPIGLNIKEILISLLMSPIYFGLYLIVNIYTQILSTRSEDISTVWDISSSSKSLI